MSHQIALHWLIHSACTAHAFGMWGVFDYQNLLGWKGGEQWNRKGKRWSSEKFDVEHMWLCKGICSKNTGPSRKGIKSKSQLDPVGLCSLTRISLVRFHQHCALLTSDKLTFDPWESPQLWIEVVPTRWQQYCDHLLSTTYNPNFPNSFNPLCNIVIYKWKQDNCIKNSNTNTILF